jgi:hypothetical protein
MSDLMTASVKGHFASLEKAESDVNDSPITAKIADKTEVFFCSIAMLAQSLEASDSCHGIMLQLVASRWLILKYWGTNVHLLDDLTLQRFQLSKWS